jgi:hypothetical protein
MVETFTPAVCGSRARQRLAIVLFAVGAILASAALGAILGLVGGFVGTRPALIGAAALAFLALLREAGILRVPVPQFRRQVPERWQYHLPLPLWSTGYGAGLGVGFLTFQPVATFWVACAVALALGRPILGAGCFAFYGAGRAFMATWPRRREPSGPAAVEKLVGRASLVPRANAVVLALAVVLLAVAPAAGAAVTSLGRGFDPAADGKTLARAWMDSGTIKVRVNPPDPDPTDTFSPANAPALSGDYLAYEDAEGIKVVDWRNDTPVEELDGPYSRPALAWPLLAYIRDDGAYERLILVDLSNPGNPTERRIASVRPAADLGRPALRGGRLAWHRILHGGSSINVLSLATNERSVIKRTHIWMEANPSVTARRIVWVEHRPRGSYLRMKWFGSKRTKTLMHMNGRKRFLWTTALTGRTAYVTKWTPSTRKSVVLRVNF